jgi:hypothetical protein
MSRSAHRALRRPSVRAARIAAFAAIPAAVILSGALIAGGSYSAFSATTQNPTNNWTTGTVALTDDDSNSAMFTATGLKPGSTGTNCITVTSTGTLASAVKLYATSTATGTLAPYITLKVEQGTSSGANGTSFGSCSNFTSQSTLYTGLASTFSTTYTGYSNGLATWSPTGSGSEYKAFRFTYTVDPTLTNTYQGATAGLGFTWEAQNS